MRETSRERSRSLRRRLRSSRRACYRGCTSRSLSTRWIRQRGSSLPRRQCNWSRICRWDTTCWGCCCWIPARMSVPYRSWRLRARRSRRRGELTSRSQRPMRTWAERKTRHERVQNSRVRSRRNRRRPRVQWRLQTRWTRDRTGEMRKLGFRLFDREDLVCRNVGEPLNNAAGPRNLYFFDDGIRAKAEVNAGVAGTGIAHGCRRFVPLGVAVGSGNADLRAKAHAVTARADEAQEKPMLARSADIAKELDGLVETGDDGVDAAGVEDVPKGRAAMCTGDLDGVSGAGADVLALAVAEIAEDGIGLRVGLGGDGLLNVVHDIGTSDKEILPAIVVKVVNAVAPAGHAVGELTDTAGVVGIDEGTAALVDVEREALVLDRGVPDVRQAIVVDVAEISTHAGQSIPVRRVGDARGNGDLFELFPANIAEE